MRVFLDANVLFSAAYRETGSVRAFSALAEAGACDLVTSGYAVDEARRNIRAKHPQQSPDLEVLLERVELCREPAPATVAWAGAQRLPAKNAPILAAAIDAETFVGDLRGRRPRHNTGGPSISSRHGGLSGSIAFAERVFGGFKVIARFIAFDFSPAQAA